MKRALAGVGALASLCLALSPLEVKAAVIAAGTDTTTGPNWRTAAALESDSQYGTLGYVVFGLNAPEGVFEAPYWINGSGNNNGVANPENLVSLPAGIGITGSAVGIAMWSGNGNFGVMENPNNGNATESAPLLAYPASPFTLTITRATSTGYKITLMTAADANGETYQTSVNDGSGAVTQSITQNMGLGYSVFIVSPGTSSITITVPSDPAGGNYFLTGIAFDAPPATTPVTTPAFAPTPGNYPGSVNVTMTDGTPGSTIYYTTDGSSPTTNSTVYSAPVNFATPNSSVTFKAFAHTNSASWTDSSVAIATYSTYFGPFVWTNNFSGGSWGNPINWTPNIPAAGAGQLANFSTLTMTANQTITLDGSKTIGAMSFGDVGNTYAWTLNTGSNGVLTLDNGAGAPVISNTVPTAINTSLAGTNGFIKVGTASISLGNGASSFTGDLIINNGGVYANGATGNANPTTSSLGNPQAIRNIVVNSGTFLSFGAHDMMGDNNSTPVATIVVNGGSVSNATWFDTLGPVTLNAGQLFAESGSAGAYGYEAFYLREMVTTLPNAASSVIASSGNTYARVHLSSATVFDVADGAASDDLIVSAPLIDRPPTGAGGLAKMGAGTMVLSGINTYTGNTVVSNGILRVESQIAGGTVSVLGGKLICANGSTIAGNVVNNSGGTLALGGNAVASVSMSAGLMMNAGSTNVMRINKTGGTRTSDQISGLASVNYGGTLIVQNITSDATPLTIGDTFTIYGAGAYAGSFANFVLPALSGALSWDVSGLSTSGTIVVANIASTPIFNPAAGGYVGAQSVTVSSLTSGAVIHYTVDGSDPFTSGTVITAASPVVVAIGATTNVTIRAYASASGFGNSGAASANYITLLNPVWLGDGSSTASGSWTDTSKWLQTVVAGGRGVSADFSTLNLGSLVGDATVTLDGARTIGSLTFGDTGNAYSWTLNTGSGGPLILAASGASTITVSNQTATINADISGTNSVVKGGSGTLVLGGAGSDFSGNLTINGTVVAASAAGGLNPTTSSLGSPSTTNRVITINSGGLLAFSSTDTLGNHRSSMNVSFVVNGGLITNYGTAFNDLGPITLNGGTLASGGGNGFNGVFDSFGLKGDITVVGSVPSVITQDPAAANASMSLGNAGVTNVTFNVADVTGNANVDLAVSATFIDGCSNSSAVFVSQPSGLTKTGAGTMSLDAANSFTGGATINNGTLRVNGSLAGGSAVTVAGGTLSGTGVIGGPVTVQAGGNLAPGLAGSIGVLTISNRLALSGTATMRLNKTSGTNDAVAGLTNIVYGGTLALSNLAGSLAVGDSFQLFSSGASSGNFAGITPLTPGTGLAWHFTPASGVLSVVTGPNTSPTSVTNSVNGNQLTLSWPADHTGWRLMSQTNSSSVGLSNTWYPVSGSEFVHTVTITIDATKPTVFYRLQYP